MFRYFSKDQKFHRVSTIAECANISAPNDVVIYVEETKTFYEYKANDTTVINDESCLQASPTHAKWIAVAGQFSNPTGDFLAIVTSDTTLQGDGTPTSPLSLGTFTPGRLVVVNTDGSLIDIGELTWDNVNKRLGINKTNPTYKVDIVAATGETTFLSITGNGVSESQGFARLTNATGSPNVFDPIFWAKSSNAAYPGWDFLADSASDIGNVPVLRFGARINNGTVVNRPLLDITNLLTSVIRILANGNVAINTLTPTKKLHVGGDAGYVSAIDEGAGDLDFASRKTVKTFGKQSLTTKAPVITVWAESDYRDGQVKTTKAEYYNETTSYYEQRFDWNEDMSVKRIEIKDDISGLWVQRNYTWTDGIPSVSESTITAWTI